MGAEAAAGEEARVTFLEGDPGGDLKLASLFRPLKEKSPLEMRTTVPD